VGRTWSAYPKRGKSFAGTEANLVLPLSDHNEVLSGDALTTLSLNYEWRRVISNALQRYADSIILPYDKDPTNDDDELDAYRNQWQALIDDLYTVDPTMQEPCFITLNRDSNQTITGGTPDAIDWNDLVTGSDIVLWDGTPADSITIPVGEGGFYQISGTIWFPSSGSSHSRQVQLQVNGTNIYQVGYTSTIQASLPFSHGTFLVSNDVLKVMIVSPTTIVVAGSNFGLTSLSVVRVPFPI